MIHNLLSALLYDEFPFPPSSPAAFITIDSSTELAPITHVYSHVVRTYHPLRIIITSPSLPRLASAPASNDKSELVQSLPGRCRWIDESEVEGANTGGAVGKVWEERERDRQGLPRPASKLKSKKVTANRGGEKRKIGGGGGKEARVPKRRKEESDSHSAEETIGSESQEEPREEKLVVKKPYKKRRIAASNEDEDD
jgi:A/G-specific adenine glycosylase